MIRMCIALCAGLSAGVSIAAASGHGAPLAPLPPGEVSPNRPLVPVLIQYRSAPTAADVAALEAAGAVVTRRYRLVPGVAAQIPAGLELQLGDDPRIVAVDADAPGQWHDEYTDTWGVARIGGQPAHTRGLTGRGVRLGIMDSGIHAGHPDLAENYVFGYDFEAMTAAATDPFGHGTHVSGTAAAVANGVGVIGTAPGASIYMLKVGTWAPSSSAAIAALEWAVDNDIQVTNSSFGLLHSALLQMAYDAAWEAGIVNVAASGNDSLGTVGAPARYASVIAVGATDSSDRVASFSTYGVDLDLCAPGVRVNSTYGASGYDALDGTSMASPHVTGAAALVIAAGVRDTSGNGRINDEVVARLLSTAVDIGEPGFDLRTGWGRVDAASAADLCRADIDGSGGLDFFDFLMFQTLFAAGDLGADFSGDGELDFFDFLQFQSEFGAGCD
jgi:subtilisin